MNPETIPPNSPVDAALQDALMYQCARGRVLGGWDLLGRFAHPQKHFANEVLEEVIPAGQITLNGAGLDGVTHAAVRLAMARCGGVQARAARMLKVQRGTLNGMLKRMALLPE